MTRSITLEFRIPYVFIRPTGGGFGCSPVTHAPIKEIVVSPPVVLYSIELEEEATLVMFNLIQP